MPVTRPPQAQEHVRRSVIPYLLALPPLILLRRQLGLRLLHPGRVFLASALVVAGPHATNVFYRQPLNTPVLAILAGIVFSVGMRHRLGHSRELAVGASQIHTLETGQSLLAPLLHIRSMRLAAGVDAAACIVAGYLATYVCAPLGVFVMLCGAALALVEFRAHAVERRDFLDAHDSLREAERHGRMAEHHSGAFHRSPARPQAGGTPAGAGDDIFDLHLSRRRDQA